MEVSVCTVILVRGYSTKMEREKATSIEYVTCKRGQLYWYSANFLALSKYWVGFKLVLG